MYRTLHKRRKDRALDLFIAIKSVLKNSKLDPDEFIFIFILGNYGEHTYTLGHLPTLRRKSKICLVITDEKKWLTEFYKDSFDFCVSIPENSNTYYEELFDISYLHPGFPYVVFTDILCNGRFNSDLIRQGRLTLSESYAFALELPLNSELTAPVIQNKNTTIIGNASKYTLLIPNAITAEKLPQDFWINLYLRLEGENLNPIIDSTFLPWSTDHHRSINLIKSELIHFYNNECSSIIGIRSGILDLLGGLTKNSEMHKMISILPVNLEKYTEESTGISVVGATKYLGVNLCWNSDNIKDIEIDTRNYSTLNYYSDIIKYLKNE